MEAALLIWLVVIIVVGAALSGMMVRRHFDRIEHITNLFESNIDSINFEKLLTSEELRLFSSVGLISSAQRILIVNGKPESDIFIAHYKDRDTNTDFLMCYSSEANVVNKIVTMQGDKYRILRVIRKHEKEKLEHIASQAHARWKLSNENI